MKKIGFLINPIAGMGGKVALKGTDGTKILQEAINRGATPVAIHKARSFFKEIANSPICKEFEFYLPQGVMGEGIFEDKNIILDSFNIQILAKIKVPKKTSKIDTERIVKEFKRMNIDLIIFVGGDGTAQDVFSVIGNHYPMLGIPSGVKIHSGVFALTASKACEVVERFVQGQVEFIEGEIIDLDEDAFREGKLRTQLYGTGLVPQSPSHMQLTKSSNYITDREKDNIQGLINALHEEVSSNTLYFLGSGSTIKKIAIVFNKSIQDQKTLLGIDAVFNNQMLKIDLSESDILDLIKKYQGSPITFLLTPIGGQGFILGRGNQQISPLVINTVGINAFQIIATRSKINYLSNRLLHVDTGDVILDKSFMGYHKVLVDYNEYWMIKVK